MLLRAASARLWGDASAPKPPSEARGQAGLWGGHGSFMRGQHGLWDKGGRPPGGDDAATGPARPASSPFGSRPPRVCAPPHPSRICLPHPGRRPRPTSCCGASERAAVWVPQCGVPRGRGWGQRRTCRARLAPTGSEAPFPLVPVTQARSLDREPNLRPFSAWADALTAEHTGQGPCVFIFTFGVRCKKPSPRPMPRNFLPVSSRLAAGRACSFRGAGSVVGAGTPEGISV